MDAFTFSILIVSSVTSAAIGFAVSSLMYEHEAWEICPKCKGLGGFEVGPNDWEDCNMCDTYGRIKVK